MVYIPKRELMHKNRQQTYKNMYDDVCGGLSWGDLAKKYNYKNANTVRVIYYRHVVPFMKQTNL